MPNYQASIGLGARQHPEVEVELLRDHQACIPLTRILHDGDMLLLLSPLVEPLPGNANSSEDPFERFGRALQRRHGPVAHVPYRTVGITSFHIDKIRAAKAVIFIISGAPMAGQPSQVDMAEIARMAGDNRPQIIGACRNARDLGLLDGTFPTILQLPGYAPQYLEDAAAVLFGEITATPSGNIGDMAMFPEAWEVEHLARLERMDIEPIQALWNQCLPDQFHLDLYGLQSLLYRDGISRHYVVRKPGTKEILGFCATYTTFADGNDDNLIGSLAMLLVQPSYRGKGVGLSLHDHALSRLIETRRVKNLQLGSTFPRLLCGVPTKFASEAWFQRRGWNMDSSSAGRGQEICDCILSIPDWPGGGLATAPQGFSFRQCSRTYDDAVGNQDFYRVRDFVFKESFRNSDKNLFEQYRLGRDHSDDIVLGLYGTDIVATAITYVPRSGSPCESDLPWPRTIGDDIGGITCIVIAEEWANIKDRIMIRLLEACITVLQQRGMQRVFLDGIKEGLEGFQSLGFQPWARYRDVWRSVQDAADYFKP